MITGLKNQKKDHSWKGALNEECENQFIFKLGLLIVFLSILKVHKCIG